MLIKVLHQEKNSRKLLVEFLNKVFEPIPICVHCVGNLRFQCHFLKIKNITTQETQFIEILHTVPK